MMKPSAEKTKRQCWDCLKRRLVCDFTRPHCKKCIKNGRQCSGYDEKKPLQWVEPGHVLSRKRRKARPDPKSTATACLQLTESERDSSIYGMIGTNLSCLENECKDAVVVTEKPLCVNYVGEVLSICDRLTIELVVTERKLDQAQNLLQQAPCPEKALKALEHMLTVLEREKIPTYNLQDGVVEVVQAVHYLNRRMYPQSKVSDVLVPNGYHQFFPLAALHFVPPAVHHGIVCISLGHFINSLPRSSGKRVAEVYWDKIYQHRGAAIRELRASISRPEGRCSDATITSVFMFLAVEMQSGFVPGLRTHAVGLMQLFELRGGMMSLYRTTNYLRPTILVFIFIIMHANWSLPASSQILTTPSLDTFLSEIDEIYPALFPQCLCPQPLLHELVRINYMRYEAAHTSVTDDKFSDLTRRAEATLARISAFNPSDWAQPGAHFDDWLAIGSVHKHSIAVYCIMSLSSLAVLPPVSEPSDLRKTLSAHGHQLLRHLKPAVLSLPLRRHLSFSLLAAGIEAIYREESEKRWIEGALVDVGCSMGARWPAEMAKALRKYWERGEMGWEEYFWDVHSLGA